MHTYIMNEKDRNVNNKNADGCIILCPQIVWELNGMMNGKRTMPSSGMGLWLLIGIAVGAAACLGVCGTPAKRRVRRRLMHAADAVNEAIDNMYSAMK